jgi:hypothetical protein
MQGASSLIDCLLPLRRFLLSLAALRDVEMTNIYLASYFRNASDFFPTGSECRKWVKCFVGKGFALYSSCYFRFLILQFPAQSKRVISNRGRALQFILSLSKGRGCGEKSPEHMQEAGSLIDCLLPLRRFLLSLAALRDVEMTNIYLASYFRNTSDFFRPAVGAGSV